jgi:hypothetical protein
MNTYFFFLCKFIKKSFTEWRNRGFWTENQTKKSSCYRMCFLCYSGDKYGCNIKIILEEGTKKQYLLKLTLQ